MLKKSKNLIIIISYVHDCGAGGNYWRLTADGVAGGFPRPIAADWAGLPANIDAAFTWPDSGATYIFKGAVA